MVVVCILKCAQFFKLSYSARLLHYKGYDNHLFKLKYTANSRRNDSFLLLPNKVLQSFSLFIRCESSIGLRNLLDRNENLVTRFLDSVMEDDRKNKNFAGKLNFSLSQKKIQEVSKLLSDRASICDNLILVDELRSDVKKDKELLAIADLEKEDYKNQLRLLDHKLILLFLPEEPHDTIQDLLLEIKHGVGGKEAMLFAKDLFEMYCRYITYKGWNYDIAEYSLSDLGGLRTSSLLVYGKDAFKCLCFEGGVHRVQRVPLTEKSGRIHTSTVGVAVLPQPSEIEVVINDKDLKIETKKASGAGGQHVNTTDSAVRITHLPTGIVVECQENRSQQRNRIIAIQKLRATLYQQKINDQVLKMKTKRKLQFGTGGRSEKIRTYNFNQDRITDHRIGFTIHNMQLFLEGTVSLDNLLTTLQAESELERLSEFISNLKVD